MADSFWSRIPSVGMLKRPRSEYDLPPGHEIHSYLPLDDDRGGLRDVKDTKTIGSAYDRYLQNVQVPSFTPGEASTFGGGVGLERAIAGGMLAMVGRPAPELTPNGRNIGFVSQLPGDTRVRLSHETTRLPPDASSTLYVEGLPADSRKREVAHIFRPFVGYKEVRLVTKESKQPGGDPLILCFVDFESPACAATAMTALQGYRMDDEDSDSGYLRLQFARNPGPRSGFGSRGKR